MHIVHIVCKLSVEQGAKEVQVEDAKGVGVIREGSLHWRNFSTQLLHQYFSANALASVSFDVWLFLMVKTGLRIWLKEEITFFQLCLNSAFLLFTENWLEEIATAVRSAICIFLVPRGCNYWARQIMIFIQNYWGDCAIINHYHGGRIITWYYPLLAGSFAYTESGTGGVTKSDEFSEKFQGGDYQSKNLCCRFWEL